jgi:hypothetical protein
MSSAHSPASFPAYLSKWALHICFRSFVHFHSSGSRLREPIQAPRGFAYRKAPTHSQPAGQTQSTQGWPLTWSQTGLVRDQPALQEILARGLPSPITLSSCFPMFTTRSQPQYLILGMTRGSL